MTSDGPGGPEVLSDSSGASQPDRTAGPLRGAAPLPALLPAAAAAVLACLLGVLTSQVVAGGPLTGADMPVHRWVLRNGQDQSSPLWVPLASLGDARVTVPVLAVAAAIAWWRLRRVALRPLLLSGVAAVAFTGVLEAMKAAIGRAAPGTGSDAAFTGGGAFPSGHTSGAAVMWGLAVWLVLLAAGRPADRSRASRYACLTVGGLAGLTAGTAMARMDFHWFSDIAGGWLLGMITLLAVIAAQPTLGRARAIKWRAGATRTRPGAS